MKKSILTSLLVLLTASWISAQTSGNLTVVATTSSAGGNYAPKNIVAIWIEDEQGIFVKTLLAYAQNRKTHLNTWEASTTAAGSAFNTVDAVTGATKPSHATRSCTWNGTDINGTLVPDGMYKVRMELTDKNSTGNFSTFSFTKDTSTQNLTPGNVPSFSSISINWDPLPVGIGDHSFVERYNIQPNPTTGMFAISGENVREVQVMNLSGVLVCHSNSTLVDISLQPDGIYLVKIMTDKGTITRKVFKNGL